MQPKSILGNVDFFQEQNMYPAFIIFSFIGYPYQYRITGQQVNSILKKVRSILRNLCIRDRYSKSLTQSQSQSSSSPTTLHSKCLSNRWYDRTNLYRIKRFEEDYSFPSSSVQYAQTYLAWSREYGCITFSYL